MSFSMTASKTVACAPAKAFKGLTTKAVAPVAKVSNAVVANEMMVWTPFNNKNFETFSFLPPLTDNEIAKQVDYIVANGWTPCLEFAPEDQAYVSSESTIRFGGSASCNYYDNRYWTMWKLPMFGCQDANQVLGEVAACTSAFADCYVRLVAFDSIVQCQTVSFLVHRPESATDYTEAANRSIQG